jgi:hypothetical protein
MVALGEDAAGSHEPFRQLVVHRGCVMVQHIEVGPVAFVLMAMPPEFSGIQVQVTVLVISHLKLPVSDHLAGSLRLFMSAGTVRGSP